MYYINRYEKTLLLFNPGGKENRGHVSLLKIIMYSEMLIKQVTVVDCIQEISNGKIKVRLVLTIDSVFIF